MIVVPALGRQYGLWLRIEALSQKKKKKKRRRRKRKDPSAPQLFQLLFLDVLDALAALLSFLLEAAALFEGSEPVLHVFLLVLTHLPSELVGMLEAPLGFLLLFLLLPLNLLSLSPGKGTKGM